MKFLQMFEGMDGSTSAMRVLTAFVTVAIVGAWAVISIQKGELQAMSVEQVSVVLGALGIKAWQRGKEGDPPSITSSSTTTTSTKTNP